MHRPKLQENIIFLHFSYFLLVVWTKCCTFAEITHIKTYSVMTMNTLYLLKHSVLPPPNQLKAAAQSVRAKCSHTFARIVLLLVMMVSSTAAMADRIIVDAENINYEGIGYHLYHDECDDCYAELRYGKMYGDIVIPSYITYNDREYWVWEINDYAFSYCEITSVVIPESVFYIRECAFANCSRLTTVTFEGSPCLGANVFENCKALETINCLDKYSAPSFESTTFSTCAPLSNITVNVPRAAGSTYWKFSDAGMNVVEDPGDPNVIYDIEIDGMTYDLYKNDTHAVLLRGKDDLQTFPATVTFDGVEYTITEIGDEAFFFCEGLGTLKLPETITKIGTYAFSNASMKAIYFPNSVTEIPNMVLFQSSVDLVSIGNAVSSIGVRAFECGAETIVSNTPTPPAIDEYEEFYEEMIVMTLIVPKGCKAAYAAAPGWSAFGKIREIGDLVDVDDMTEDELRAALKAHRNGDFNEDGTVSVKDVTDLVNKVLQK